MPSTWPSAHGIKLVGADITTKAGEAGSWATFPPPGGPVSAYLDWSEHVPALGDHVAGGKTTSGTLGTEPARTGLSSASDVEVRYRPAPYLFWAKPGLRWAA